MKITFIGPIYILKINSITLKKQPLSLYWNTTEEKIKPDEEYIRVLGIYISTEYKTRIADKEEATEYLNRQLNKKEKKIINYMTLNNMNHIDQDNEYLHELNIKCSCPFHNEKEIRPKPRRKR